jgi:hypothetical protein
VFIGHYGCPDGSDRGNHWSKFQNRHEALGLVLHPVAATPAVSLFGFRVAGEIEDLDLAMPERLVLKYLVNGYRVTVDGGAPMQLLDCLLKTA